MQVVNSILANRPLSFYLINPKLIQWNISFRPQVGIASESRRMIIIKRARFALLWQQEDFLWNGIKRLYKACGASDGGSRHWDGVAFYHIIKIDRGTAAYYLSGILSVTGFIKTVIADSFCHKVANAVITVGILCLKVLVNHSMIHFNIWPIIFY